MVNSLDCNLLASEVAMIESRTQVEINKKNQLKIVNISLPIIFSICFGCSKEPSH